MNQLSTSSIAKLTSTSLGLSLFTLSVRYLTVPTSRPSLPLSNVVSLRSISLFGQTKRPELYMSSYNLGLVLSHTIAALNNIAL